MTIAGERGIARFETSSSPAGDTVVASEDFCCAAVINFERPRLDPELRPALVRLPDIVRFEACAGRSRVVVRVSREAVERHLYLDRPAQWRDFDAIWPAIRDVAERKVLAGAFDPRDDERTGLPVVTLGRRELA